MAFAIHTRHPSQLNIGENSKQKTTELAEPLHACPVELRLTRTALHGLFLPILAGASNLSELCPKVPNAKVI